MQNPFARRPASLDSAPAAPDGLDPVHERVLLVRDLAGALLEQHVRANGLHKLSKEAVRNAMLYAHSLELSLERYEVELRNEAFDTKHGSEEVDQ